MAARVRVVLVGIEGPANLGLIARTCLNFGVDELYLVNPVASVEEALRYAAHGDVLLRRARVVRSLREALEGVELSAATSAIGHARGDVLRQAMPLEEFADKILARARSIALVFGRESTGLTREELEAADFLVTIPANPEYPVLNVAQSVAIFLWEAWKRRGAVATNVPPRASREELEEVASVLQAITGKVVGAPEKAARCDAVIRRVLFRSAPSRLEGRILLYWSRRLARALGVARGGGRRDEG
ncbi:MAG: RNA methyltransferase [Desulfurococcaceae archaeon]